ncbi:MAG TPA: hypothetical protein VFR93_00030 [Candidatus Limnocylindrales bacterium]|nr:hypothetical protein [Candidatus Limnocylindrales bacterium]
MNPALVALAIATVAGGVLAVSSRDVRSVVLGLLVVLAAAPLVADPWPSPLAALARIAAALLAARLVIVGVRDLGATVGSRIGWPAAAILGAAAAVAGYGSHGLGATPLGPAAAQAAGFGLIVLSLAPLVLARDVFRLGVGAVLLVSGAQLVRVALDRPMTDAGQLVAALLVVGLGGAVAVIAAAARAAGGLEAAALDRGGRGPQLPDAHRVEEPAARRRSRGPRVGARTGANTEAEPRA